LIFTMTIKSIAIEVTSRAFLPEAHAYKNYLQNRGYCCEFVNKGSAESLSYDAIVLFHGFHPFWRRYPDFIIGEYHSLSVGRLSRLKDFIKRLLNVRADFYVFLNESVKKKIWHSKTRPYVLRGMGFDQDQFNSFKKEPKKYDIIYAGSPREGLIERLETLASLDLTIALVGFDYAFQNSGITCFGRRSPEETRKIISQSHLGLNYTPDVFPLNIQDSTKVIEYCGAGLGVITNRYVWVNEFERRRSARFLDLDLIGSKNDVAEFNFVVPDVSDLDWNKLSANVYESLFQSSASLS